MKVKLTNDYQGPCIPLNYELLRILNVKLGDSVEIDVQMVGNGIIVHKAKS